MSPFSECSPEMLLLRLVLTPESLRGFIELKEEFSALHWFTLSCQVAPQNLVSCLPRQQAENLDCVYDAQKCCLRKYISGFWEPFVFLSPPVFVVQSGRCWVLAGKRESVALPVGWNPQCPPASPSDELSDMGYAGLWWLAATQTQNIKYAGAIIKSDIKDIYNTTEVFYLK